MISKFYGLSAVTLVMSPISPTAFKKMVGEIDSPTNQKILAFLKKDFSELIKFLDSLDFIYESPEARRASVKLKNKMYKTPEEKMELEKILKSSKKILSPLRNKDKISENSYTIIKYLYSNMDRIKFFESNIKFGTDSNAEIALGERIYLLKIQSLSSLVNRLYSMYKGSRKLSQFQIDSLRKDVSLLQTYMPDEEYNDSEIVEHDTLENVIKSQESLIEQMDVSYFNDKLGLNLTEEEYLKVTIELYNLGCVGFTVYTKHLIENFKSSISLSLQTSSSKKIASDSPLFSVVKLLQEVVENVEVLG